MNQNQPPDTALASNGEYAAGQAVTMQLPATVAATPRRKAVGAAPSSREPFKSPFGWLLRTGGEAPPIPSATLMATAHSCCMITARTLSQFHACTPLPGRISKNEGVVCLRT